MRFSHRLRAASALCAALAVLTVGCKKDTADEAAQQTSPGTVAGAPAPAATNQFRVENIEPRLGGRYDIVMSNEQHGELHNHGQYTAFGRVIDGMTAVEAIEKAPVNGETPLTRIDLRTVRIEKK